MAPPSTFYHALLRPCVLQILRAAGYHGAKTAVVDALTDLAARYLSALSRATAQHAAAAAAHGYPGAPPTVVDVRMALQDCGALLPEKNELEQEYTGVEDMRGVEAFIAFATGPVCKEIRRIALDGEEDATDYLTVLKKKHSKSEDDSKWNGTILGKGHEHGLVPIEGGEIASLQSWNEALIRAAEGPAKPAAEVVADEASPASSALSSLAEDMYQDVEGHI